MDSFKGDWKEEGGFDAPQAAELMRSAKRHLVQPWPAAGAIGDEARGLIGSGEGIYVTDEAGRKLIDGPAGMWCVNVGHRRDELAERCPTRRWRCPTTRPGTP